jgi:Fe-S-cluster containining protein
MDNNNNKKLINFQCTRCGTCCTWDGYVRLTPEETVIIAEFLNISVPEFTDKFTDITEDRRNLTLIEKEDGSCIFFNPSPPSCDINKVKPKQCQNFPIKWNFNNWEDKCQGIKTFK